MNEEIKSEPLLILRHKTYRSHREYWFEMKDGRVYVNSYTPHNSPKQSTGIYSHLGAMYNYILMTTTEGWEVISGLVTWHDYVMNAMEVENA